jgi:hypothetical protein
MSKQPAAKPGDKKAQTKDSHTDQKLETFQVSTGYGKFEFQNKIVYIGSYKQIKEGVKIREGHGKLIHPSNDNSEFGQEYYEGEWKEDKMNGMGVYHYSNGDIYEGEFKNDMHHGNGKYYFTDGSKYDGDWKEHRMHGTGKYWDINNIVWSGEFREGNFISKDQAKLKEEKRITKKINKIKEIPSIFLKSWEETFAKTDKKNIKDLLSPFFAKIENMSNYIKENYPKFEDRTPEKWNDALKFVLSKSNDPNINVPKTTNELIFLEKSALLTPQLQEDMSSGQVVEIQTILDARKINLAIAYNRDLNKWLIVHFTEIIDKKK